ncbi:ClpP-like prohead protease/major capsid protein fusion protein [Sphingomonas sp. BK235]|uniref:ClpP-like prohead protease/major capsid protein fusion protein n=1 Tax=Sphingomonas sp. BK235 TaxID=2512131 RepID=UPI0010DFC3A2|nr:ClpP-like prohead protease/major capsid protein fusion protein [Sphingomonas sp. BK235]TCP30700.1 ATP-dependent Clp endopeptidase proteolytic subunit ClpP [Sphingomonas sp. BK235]
MEILLYGIVGDSCDGLEAAWMVDRIQHAPDDITVRINSLGGLLFDGFAIYNALKQSPRKVTVIVDGVAGSIASVIAMAGDRIIMAENAVMMIHKPSDGTYGDADDLRTVADRLDFLQRQLVGIYAARTGMSEEELSPLLDAETWMSAQEALAMKFIDEISGNATATNMLDPSKFGFRAVPPHPLIANAARTPAPAAVSHQKEPIMGDEATATTASTENTPTTIENPSQPTNIADAASAAAQQAIVAERARASTIRNEVSRARLDGAFADTLVNEGVSITDARTRIIDQIAATAPVITNYSPATIPAAQFQARADAMSLAIAHRANPRNELTADARGFAGRRLIVLARDFLDSTGVSTRNMSDPEVAMAVFRYRQPRNAGQHATGDFPAVLANTVTRTLRRGYELAPRTFRPFSRQVSVPDFRPVSRVALSDISAMQQVAEGAEYQYATVGDSAEQYTVGKWGQIISLTWETIINDDLGAFDRIPQAMGQEAAQVEGDVVYAILLSNPLMADGVPLFHASHGNLAAAGSNISIDSLQAGRTAMRTQRAPKGRFTSATPAHLVVGPLREQQANQFTSANYQATINGDINPDYNRALQPQVEPRILDYSFFLAADPNAQPIDTIEYAYLAGYEGLQTEERQGFEVDGIDIKGRLVFGAKAIDHRGLYKNPGAAN